MNPAPAAVLTLLVAAQAQAQTRPQLIPTRDVAITYRVTEGGQTVEERVRWLGGADLERVDLPGPVYMIADFKARRLSLVDTAKRSVLELEAPRENVLHPDMAADWMLVGRAKVGGLDCTEWRLAAAGGQPEQVCTTAYGVLLRVQVGGKPVAQAVSVRYGRVDPKLFEVPAKFAQHPLPPAAAPPPPGTGAAPGEP